MGGQVLPRDLPQRESGKFHLRHLLGLRNAATGQGRSSALVLPKKVRMRVVPILPSRIQKGLGKLRCVTALSIEFRLTGDGSAIGEKKGATTALSYQTAPAGNASPGRLGAA